MGSCDGDIDTLSCCEAIDSPEPPIQLEAFGIELSEWFGFVSPVDDEVVSEGPKPDAFLSDSGDPTPITPATSEPPPVIVGASDLSSGSSDGSLFNAGNDRAPADEPGDGPGVSVGGGGTHTNGDVIVPF